MHLHVARGFHACAGIAAGLAALEASVRRVAAIGGFGLLPAAGGPLTADAANARLTFQVISSRLKPGCAEAGIVGAALEMVADAGK